MPSPLAYGCTDTNHEECATKRGKQGDHTVDAEVVDWPAVLRLAVVDDEDGNDGGHARDRTQAREHLEGPPSKR